jgi:predicted DNA-binding protein
MSRNRTYSQKVNIMLPHALRSEIDNLTARTGATMAEITRRALNDYLKANAEAPAPKIAIDCTQEI